jgi:N-acetylneuraminic acid mutarotase
MNNKKRISQIIVMTLLVALLLSACDAPQPAPTTVLITTVQPTSVPPTAVTPTATVIPIEISGANPSKRGYATMAFDSESQKVIMFGGSTGDYRLLSSYNFETWVFDVSTNKWTQMKPSSASPTKGGGGMAYDKESDRVITYGMGSGPDFSTYGPPETWAYDYNTNTWKEVAKGPANHLGARLAYDAESDRIILFGGFNLSDNSLYNDTWSYDFNTDTWTDMKPTTSPPGRNFQAMTYDAKSDRVLTWGGSGIDPLQPVDMCSVWAYDYNTNTWTEKKPGTGPLPDMRDYAEMAYDTKADRTILYGGVPIGSGKTDDKIWAYEYKTNSWTKLEPVTSPGLLSRHSMLYIDATDQIMLFGGQVGSTLSNYTDATWIHDFNTNTWKNVTSKP